MNKQEFVIYLAGLMDADGYFGISYSKKNYSAIISINQTKPEAISYIRKYYACSYSFLQDTRSNRKPRYFVNIRANDKLRFIKDIYPYLLIKKLQVELLIKFLNKTESLELLYRRMKQLNQVGLENKIYLFKDDPEFDDYYLDDVSLLSDNSFYPKGI